MRLPHSRWLHLSSEALRFLVVGAANTLTTFVIYWSLLRVATYSLAYTISFIVGIGLSYLLNNLFVFRTKPSVRSALAFPLVYLAQYLVGLAVLWLWVSQFKMPPAYGVLVVAVVTVPITFLLSRFVLRRLE